MKKIPEIVDEHIILAQTRATDSVATRQQIERLGKRMVDDPGLVKLAESMSNSTTTGVEMMIAAGGFPRQLVQGTIRALVILAIMEWEDINREFDDQLKQSPKS